MHDSGDETADFWNRCFRELDQSPSPVSKERSDPIIARFCECRVRSILDLGCGYGRWSIAFAQAGFHVTAVDISQEAIRLLEQWARTLSLQISTSVSDVRHLAGFDEAFDGVWCNSVLDHVTIADAECSIVNILRSLKSVGIACLSFDGQDNDPGKDWRALEDGTLLYESGRRRGMLWRYYTDQEIRTLVRETELVEFSVAASGSREVWIRK